MRKVVTLRRILGLGTMVAVASTLTGCSYIKRQEFDDRLAAMQGELRSEMSEGDEMVSNTLGERMDGFESRLSSLENELQALEREFDATVERLETAIRFNMPVYFGFDEDEIRAQDRGVLDRFAQVVKEYYPVSLVTVEGFTDPSGSAAYNKRLGMRRAESVKSYLVQANGLTPDLLRTVSYGEEVARQIRQGQRGPGNEGWENRRVVLVIDHGGAGPS